MTDRDSIWSGAEATSDGALVMPADRFIRMIEARNERDERERRAMDQSPQEPLPRVPLKEHH